DLALQAKAAEPLAALRRFIEEYPGRILFTAETAGRREVLLELLGRLKIKPREVFGWVDFLDGDERLNICIAPLDEGLLLDELALIRKARCSASGSCSAGAGRRPATTATTSSST